MKNRFVVFGAAFVYFCACAEEKKTTETLSFEEAVVAAYNSNKGWKANQTEKKSAEEDLFRAKMMFLPSVNGRISSTRSRVEGVSTQDTIFGTNTQRGTSKSTDTRFGVSVSQNLFSGLTTINRIRASDNSLKATNAKLKFEEQKLIVNVLDAYTSVWVGRQKIVALKKKEENLRKTMDSKNTSLEAGAGTPSEVAEAKANYSKAVYERIQAETELFTAEANFEKLTGLKPTEKNIELPDLSLQLPENLDKLVARAMAANCSILSGKFAERAEFDKLRVAKGALVPSCNLALNADRSLQKQKYNNSNSNFSATLTVDVPLFSNDPSQGNAYSAVEIANQHALKAKFTAEDTVLEVKKECVDNWNKYISAGAMIKACRSAVKSGEVSTESNLEENAMGTKSNTEILVKENQLLDARIDLANSRRQRIVSLMTIMALSGDLSLQTLFKKK
ncbi:MAG: TolC family protein [Holosporaceae bacterium]|jgi:outer membrane protein TolC|nr:TolC family protein [Holosporaceae bacterium]